MTGLDQDMMQKNLTCKNLSDAQKNIFWFCIVLLFANILFLTLGALLYLYADFIQMPVPSRTDNLYPLIAINHLSILSQKSNFDLCINLLNNLLDLLILFFFDFQLLTLIN